jgi:hypothetical protein
MNSYSPAWAASCRFLCRDDEGGCLSFGAGTASCIVQRHVDVGRRRLGRALLIYCEFTNVKFLKHTLDAAMSSYMGAGVSGFLGRSMQGKILDLHNDIGR